MPVSVFVGVSVVTVDASCHTFFSIFPRQESAGVLVVVIGYLTENLLGKKIEKWAAILPWPSKNGPPSELR